MSNPSLAQPQIRRCPVAHATTDQEDFEHDFTTPGVAGNLECPFAKMAQKGPPTPNSQVDPIAAEFHPDHISTASPTAAAQAAGKCPIRFLDQHSPEEVAKYFENHKHEIPRSHEICVKRYQQNENSIRQLDAKYGNLVNMIQGLGVKHKQYLPDKDKIVDNRDAASASAVEKWAGNVSGDSVPVQFIEDIDEPRQNHFETPLREIRVGESPSRPWGISVPVDKEIALSALDSNHSVDRHQSRSHTTPPAPVATGGISSSQARVKHGKSLQDVKEPATIKQRAPSPQPQIVFNGPVFFGFSAEATATFLERLKLGKRQGDA